MTAPVRALFELPDDLHYLNCAYMSPLARPVEEAVIAGLRTKRDPSRVGPADFFDGAVAVRERFATLVGGTPDRVALLPSVSYGVAIAARNLPVTAGQTIVVAGEQFPGNVYAWRRRAAETGATLVTVPRPDLAAAGAAWNSALLEAVGRDTAIVALPPLHWSDGTRFDLEAIGVRCREMGAALFVDGTQAIGGVPFDLQRVQPDALVVATYKWLMGPYGMALGWFGPRFDGGIPLEEGWITRAGSRDFGALVDYRDEYAPGAERYDVGERSNFALVPGVSAALDLVLEWTPGRVAEWCRQITTDLVDEARSLGFGVEDDTWRSPHLFGIRMPPGVDPAALQRDLEHARIVVSRRGSALRISPHLYNDDSDVNALSRVLRSAVTGR